MSRYKHFSYKERAELAKMLDEGTTRAAIAAHLGCPVCTINQEIRRNSNKNGNYRPGAAQNDMDKLLNFAPGFI